MRSLYKMLALAALLTIPVAAQTTPEDLKYDKLTYDPPAPQVVTLKNGITVYLMEDHELPVVNGYAVIKTGGIYEPGDKTGLAGLTGTLLRTGGAGALSGDSLDQELEFMASSMGSGIDRDMGEASMFSLLKNLDRTLALYADMLRRPRFEEGKLELERGKKLEEIKRRWDDPRQSSTYMYNLQVYGPDSPWARISSEKTVSSITVEDIRTFYNTYYVPQNIMLGFAGDFKTKAMLKKIKKHFGTWKKGKTVFPDVPAVKPVEKPAVYFVHKDISQANIHFGHIGANILDPQWAKIYVFDEIFGYGGFSSRLMREVRSNRGYAYIVYGGIGFGTDKGLFDVFCQTDAANMLDAVEVSKRIIDDMRTEAVTDDELERARKSFINGYVFKFDSIGKVLRRRMTLAFRGYPADFDEKYISSIQTVTKDDVLQVAKEYLAPDKMITVVVGHRDQVLDSLKTLGEVVELKFPEEKAAGKADEKDTE